jgi:hypothetical protein
VEGDVFTAPGSCHSVRIGGGVWRFKGWSAASLTFTDGDLTFTGTWRWYTDHTSAADTSEPTPAASQPRATPEITRRHRTAETPQPTASASPAMQVLEQTNSNTPAPATGSAKVRSRPNDDRNGADRPCRNAGVRPSRTDLKVLKWYDARKAARRTNA